MASANGISASDSTAYLSYAISISTLIVAVLGPVLGAVADNKNRKAAVYIFHDDGVLGCCGACDSKDLDSVPCHFRNCKVGSPEASFSTIPCLWMSRRMSGWMRCPPRAMRGDTSEGCVPFVASLGLILGADAIGISGTVAMMIAFLSTRHGGWL